ncbi:MAG: UbiX family flavin prenyltransferase [Candidatus Aenigmarchaeota archaeon]|nr:UbiX family flavin prenyltransferase [Candidatus Aenigmarchaeota archaeon]
MKLIVAITGASGVEYGIGLLKTLKEKGVETHLILSEWAEKVIELETDHKVEEIRKNASFIYSNNDMAAAVSSSSFPIDAMVVVPSTIKTVSEIVHAHTSTLISRCADNMLKMKKKLIVCLRETPLSTPTIDNLKKLSIYGAIIMPLSPGFYGKPKNINDIYNFMIGKILDCLGIENKEYKRWGG